MCKNITESFLHNLHYSVVHTNRWMRKSLSFCIPRALKKDEIEIQNDLKKLTLISCLMMHVESTQQVLKEKYAAFVAATL